MINNCHSSFVFSRLTVASTCTHSKYVPLDPHNDPVVDIITLSILQIEKCCTERLSGLARVTMLAFKPRCSGLQSRCSQHMTAAPLGLVRRGLQGKEAQDFSASFSMVPACWGSQVRAQSLQKVTVTWAPLGIP